jgi:hypothetical protein
MSNRIVFEPNFALALLVACVAAAAEPKFEVASVKPAVVRPLPAKADVREAVALSRSKWTGDGWISSVPP